MSLCTVAFHSKALGKKMRFNLLLPDSGNPPFATLYLLHGNSDDHDAWLVNSTIGRKRIENLAIVMPNGDRSRYVNSRLGGYEDYVIHDLIGFVDRTFPTIPERAGRAISGFSMGGYGAMMLGLKHYDVFSAISSHAGSYYNPLWVPRPGGWHEVHPARDILGEVCARKEYDCRYLAEYALRNGTPPSIRFDCGIEDPLLACARAMQGHFEKIGMSHTYTEHPGGHNWDYVDARLDESLAFVCSALEVNR